MKRITAALRRLGYEPEMSEGVAQFSTVRYRSAFWRVALGTLGIDLRRGDAARVVVIPSTFGNGDQATSSDGDHYTVTGPAYVVLRLERLLGVPPS